MQILAVPGISQTDCPNGLRGPEPATKVIPEADIDVPKIWQSQWVDATPALERIPGSRPSKSIKD